MPIQSNRINSATSFAFSTIAENGLVVQSGDLLSLNENGYITKAKPNTIIIGISNTKNSFPANNETEEQLRVEYSPVVWENSYKMKLSTDTSNIKVGQFYKITDSQEIDIDTMSPSVGQLMVQDIFSTYVEVRFVSSVGLFVPQYTDIKPIGFESINTDEGVYTGKYKLNLSDKTSIEMDLRDLDIREKELPIKKAKVKEDIEFTGDREAGDELNTKIDNDRVKTQTVETTNANITNETVQNSTIGTGVIETATITTADIDTLNMKKEGFGVADVNEIKAKKATLSGLTIEGAATVDDNTFEPYQTRSEKGKPNGYPSLDENGKHTKSEYLPELLKTMKWRGERDPQSGLLPTNPIHGDTYLVHADGIINGNKWTKGDLLVFDENAGGEWNRVPVGDTDGLELTKNKIEALDFENPSREKYTSELAVVNKLKLMQTDIDKNKEGIEGLKTTTLQMYSKTEVLFLINKTFDAIKDSIALLQNQVNYQNFITKLVESLKNGGLTKDQIEAILGAGNFFVDGTIVNSNSVIVEDARITQTTFVSAIIPDNAKGHISVEVQNGRIIITSSKQETNVPVSVLLTKKGQ